MSGASILASLKKKYGPLVDEVRAVLGMDADPVAVKREVVRRGGVPAPKPLAATRGKATTPTPSLKVDRTAPAATPPTQKKPAQKKPAQKKPAQKVAAAPRSESPPSRFHTPQQVIASEYNRDIAARLDGIVPNDAPLSEWRAAAANIAGPEGAASNARRTPEFRPPGIEPVVTQAGRQGLSVRGMDLVEAQHPSNFSVFAKYKTPKDPLETEVVTTPYADLPTDRMFDTSRLEGARVVSLLGDKERAGDTILSVDGMPTNVDTQGGPLFAALQEALGGDAVWASEFGALTPLRRQIAEGLEAGKPVFGVTTTMGPGALNQTIDMTDLLHQMAASSPIRKRDLAVFNKKIKAMFPEYAGLLHEEAAQQLHNMTQGQRKAFVSELDNAKALALGFPNVGAARFALTDPNLVDVPHGATGYQFVQFGPESLTTLEGPIKHRTYPDRMGGVYEGRGPLMPFDVVFSGSTKARREAGLPGGFDLRSLELSKPFQDMTPEAYDLLMKYLSKVEDPY